jgi:DNA repair photolyase
MAHIYGDSKRLFLNTELGCASNCSYCYLPIEGYQIGSKVALRISATRLLKLLETNMQIVKGVRGTIFSIGCYSECWDSKNRNETIELILGLLSFGNPIQIATKRYIKSTDLLKLIPKQVYPNQLRVYISSATISRWKEYERGTTAPIKRFESFSSCNQLGLSSFLYIKPVLPGITIQDAYKYGEVMQKYNIPAIVGDRFEKDGSDTLSPISNKLVISPHNDLALLGDILTDFGKVFYNSTDTLAVKEETLCLTL